jgi:hypothetical protein
MVTLELVANSSAEVRDLAVRNGAVVRHHAQLGETDKRRISPYVVLGLPHGASSDEAKTAWRRCLKDLNGLRHLPGPFVDTREFDINWAVETIEQCPAASWYELDTNPLTVPMSSPSVVRLPRATTFTIEHAKAEAWLWLAEQLDLIVESLVSEVEEQVYA